MAQASGKRTILTVKQPYTTKDGTRLYMGTSTEVDVDENGKYIPGSAVVSLRLYDTTSSLLGTDYKTVAIRNAGEPWRFTQDGNGNYVAGKDLQNTLANRNSMMNINLNNHVSGALSAPLQGVPAGEVNKNNPQSSNAALGGPSVAPDPATDPAGTNPEDQEQESLTPDEEKAIQDELAKGIRGRKDYSDAIYPVTLNPQKQDCIKFSIIEYQKSGLKGFGESEAGPRVVSVTNGTPGLVGRTKKPLATIVLPMPGSIQDSNTVNWSGDKLNPFMQALGDVAQTALEGGNAGEAAQRQTEAALSERGLRSAIVSKFTEGALGTGNIMQRQYGTIINPNLELLFNSPDLRTFSFSFKLSPRSPREAVEVKKIIRNFKQAMSVKRSATSFLLQSPHTFAISYIFQNKRHPYLNRFKECALTSCSVNYTPEGNYMSFDDSNEPSMVSYQIDLSFQELDPIYDDDYGQGYNTIGF